MSETFRFNPGLPFVDWADDHSRKGNRLLHGKYVNTEERRFPDWRDIARWQFGGKPRRKEKKRDSYRPGLIEGSAWLQAEQNCMVWLGHASFYIRLGGISMLTDPVLRDLPLIPRRVGVPCATSAITGLDYILLSHGHRDHLDLPTLKTLLKSNPGVEVLTAMDISKDLDGIAFRSIQEAAWYQRFDLPDGLEIDFLPAHHWNRRYLTDMNRNLWGAFMITSGNRRLYFAGDSAYIRAIYQEVGERYSGIDVAFMPIGAYEPDFIMQNSHMNPEEAAAAFRDTGAQKVVPMHYGTFDLSDEPAGDPIHRFRKAVPEVRLVESAVGQMITI